MGNDEYARQNRSFGLTTMHNRHAQVNGARVRFEFRGKSGIEHEINLDDPRLARLVRQCQEVPGQELFEYLDAPVRRVAALDCPVAYAPVLEERILPGTSDVLKAIKALAAY